jgi:hypothetical protein
MRQASRIHAATAEAGHGAYRVLDYAKREAVIIKPSSQLPLLDFFEARETLRIHLLKTVS